MQGLFEGSSTSLTSCVIPAVHVMCACSYLGDGEKKLIVLQFSLGSVSPSDYQNVTPAIAGRNNPVPPNFMCATVRRHGILFCLVNATWAI